MMNDRIEMWRAESKHGPSAKMKVMQDMLAEIERLTTDLNESERQTRAQLSRVMKRDAEIERLQLEFYHYENENTYKGNSIRHWYNKAMAYGKCLDEANRKIAKLQTAFHIACGTISTMDQWADKHPQDVVDEYLRLAAKE